MSSWNEVRATQAYLDASPEKREAIHNDYFQRVVAPNARAKGYDVDAIYRDYMANTELAPYYDHETKADMSQGEWFDNQIAQIGDLYNGGKAYLNKWTGSDYSQEDINQFKRAISSDEGQALKTTAAVGASVVAPEFLPEIAAEAAGASMLGRGSVWLANEAAANAASSVAYQAVDNGNVSLDNTLLDTGVGLGLSAGLRGIAKGVKGLSPSPTVVKAAVDATARSYRDIDELLSAKKNAYTASANTATLESVWNALKEKNPNIHFDEVLVEWGEKEPSMMKGSYSQLQRLQDTLFPDGVPEGLTTEALKSRVKAASLQTQRDLLASKNNFSIESPAVAIKAMEAMRKAGLGVPNISMLSKELSDELKLNDGIVDKLLNWSDSYSFFTPYVRKKAAERAIRSILDDTIEMIERVAERDLLESRKIDEAIPVGDDLDHVLHGSKSRAFNYRAINTQKLLKKLKLLKGSSRVETDNYGSMISEAQDLIYGDAEISDLTKVRENLAVINVINEMRKSGDAPLALKVLMTKAIGTIPDFITSPLKYIRDKRRASSAILGMKYYNRAVEYLMEIEEITHDLNMLDDVMNAEEKALKYSRIQELLSEDFFMKGLKHELGEDSELVKALTTLSKLIGKVSPYLTEKDSDDKVIGNIGKTLAPLQQ